MQNHRDSGFVQCRLWGAPHKRHTNITLLIMAGVPLQTVAKRAGHSSTVTTSMIYSHAIQTVDEMVSDVLADILKPKQVGFGG